MKPRSGALPRTRPPQLVEVMVMETFRPGREYTPEDVLLRCRDKGYDLSPDAISRALGALTKAGIVRQHHILGDRSLPSFRLNGGNA